MQVAHLDQVGLVHVLFQRLGDGRLAVLHVVHQQIDGERDLYGLLGEHMEEIRHLGEHPVKDAGQQGF